MNTRPEHTVNSPNLTALNKREYFAAQALNGLASCWATHVKPNDEVYKETAEIAVKLADSLIEELNKKTTAS